MKTRVFLYAVILGIISSFLSACKPRNAITRPPMSATVMKFKNPEHKSYILANYFEGKDCIMGMRFNRYEQPVGEAGDQPYWELSDNWLLVDWKWGTFPYNAGLVILTELTWDQFRVDSTIISHIPSWPLSEPHVEQPVEKIWYINLSNLKEYSNASYDVQLIDYLWSNISLEDNYIDTMDSIWTVVQRDLSVAIENGDLAHINDDKYNPYK